jgi:hypothetical protein
MTIASAAKQRFRPILMTSLTFFWCNAFGIDRRADVRSAKKVFRLGVFLWHKVHSDILVSGASVVSLSAILISEKH